MTTSAVPESIDIAAARQQLQELQALHASGTLTRESYDEGRARIERRILELVSGNASGKSPIADRPARALARPARRLLPILLGVGLLAGAAGYGWMRYSAPAPAIVPASPVALVSAVSGGGAAILDPHGADIDQITGMTDRLAAKLKDRPQDSEGWAMLARSYGVLKRYPEAIAAYETAITLRGDDNVLRADYAEARKLAGLPPDSRGAAVPMPANKPPMAAATGQTVSGTVTLAPALMKKANPQDTVFIFARASEGSRMPLALLRKQVKDLPVVFTLDDSMAMSPASTLSKASSVIVGARVSKSSNAIPEKGDFAGQSAPVLVGAKGLAIEISEVVLQ